MREAAIAKSHLATLAYRGTGVEGKIPPTPCWIYDFGRAVEKRGLTTVESDALKRAAQRER